MGRTIIFYAIALAAAAAALSWLEYQYFAPAFSSETYIAILALGFMTVGAWAAKPPFDFSSDGD